MPASAPPRVQTNTSVPVTMGVMRPRYHALRRLEAADHELRVHAAACAEAHAGHQCGGSVAREADALEEADRTRVLGHGAEVAAGHAEPAQAAEPGVHQPAPRTLAARGGQQVDVQVRGPAHVSELAARHAAV